MAHLSSSAYLKIGEEPVESNEVVLETILTGESDYKYRWLKTDQIISPDHSVSLIVNGNEEQIIFIDHLQGLILTHDKGDVSYTLNMHKVPTTIFAEVFSHYISLETDSVDCTTYLNEGFKRNTQGLKTIKVGVSSLDIKYAPNYGDPILFEYSNGPVTKRGYLTLMGSELGSSIYAREEDIYIYESAANKKNWNIYYGTMSLPEVPLSMTWGTLPLTWDSWEIWNGGVI